jgi:NADPH-dependent ferric siderophore reductase
VFPEPQSWQLSVEQVEDITPRMRRIRFTSPQLERFAYLPGQDLALAFSDKDGTVVRRRYTIRSFEQEQRLIEINVVMHGEGPGMRWAKAVSMGASIEAIAPRGKITVAPDAAFHVFAGDATAVPAALAMMQALPPNAPAFGIFIVDNAAERQAAAHGFLRSIEWRFAADQAGVTDLSRAIAGWRPPEEAGHAYLAGEVALVSSLKNDLLGQGWAPERISAKAYWNRGRANAARGEPEQKVA